MGVFVHPERSRGAVRRRSAVSISVYLCLPASGGFICGLPPYQSNPNALATYTAI